MINLLINFRPAFRPPNNNNTTKLIYLTQEGAGKIYIVMFHPQNTSKFIYLTGRVGGQEGAGKIYTPLHSHNCFFFPPFFPPLCRKNELIHNCLFQQPSLHSHNCLFQPPPLHSFHCLFYFHPKPNLT